MATISPSLRSLELEPIAGSSHTAETHGAASSERLADPPAAAPANARLTRDELAAFMATAAREYETGWIDRPLWESILAQSKGDEALAKGVYLRTRATILQLDKRDQGPKSPPQSQPPGSSNVAAAPPESVPVEPAPVVPARRMPPPWMIGAVAAGCVVVGGVAWLLSSGGKSDAATQAPATAAVHRPAAAAAARNGTAVVPVIAGSAATVVPPDDGLVERIARLSEAGNWNVVVLLASEWTRREPANVHAWTQLSVGYMKLRQMGEALDAATKATQLAPVDPLAWRTLGRVNLELDRAADALRAFEQVVALDARDVQSLVRVGMLDAQLSRLPEAKSAFDRALSANPDDVDAACGQAYVARQQGFSKDADAMEKVLQARGRNCRDGNDQGRAAKVAVQPAQPMQSTQRVSVQPAVQPAVPRVTTNPR